MHHYVGNYDIQTTMSMRKTKMRSSTAQINAMVKYMTKGAQSSKDDFDTSVDIPELGDEEWERLAEALNKIGPAVKNVAAWKVSWRDLKRSSRMKQVDKVVSTEQAQSFISDGVIPGIAGTTQAEKQGYYLNRKMRSSNAQINTLVEYMAKNKRLARGEYSDPAERRRQDHQWIRLASILNEMGPAVKNVAAWRVSWRDLTRSSRRKQPRTEATACLAERVEEIMSFTGIDEADEDANVTIDDSNERPSLDLDNNSPPSPEQLDSGEEDVLYEAVGREGSEHEASELESPEVSEESGTDSSPCASPTPDGDDSGGGKVRCTTEQIKGLVDCMAINPSMAFGKQDTPEKIEDWKHLRQLLNRQGPPKRTEEWRKYWRMLRRQAVMKLNAKSKCGMKIPEITKKIVEIVEAHNVRQQDEPEEKSEDDFEMLPPRVLSPGFRRTLPDLDPSKEIGTVVNSVQNTGQIPVTHTQVSLEQRNDKMSSECSQDRSQDISMDIGIDDNAQDSDIEVEEPLINGRRAKRRCNNTQIAALVKYMSAHPDLAARGYISRHANAIKESKWRQITKHLNKLGTAKTTEAWKRTWKDLQTSVRSRKLKQSKWSAYLYQEVQEIMEANPPKPRKPSPGLDDSSNGGTEQIQVPTPENNSVNLVERDTEQPTRLKVSDYDRNIHCTKAQINALLNYMWDHPALAICRSLSAGDLNKRYAQWRQLTKYLNKIGPPKSMSGWKSTWKYYTLNAGRKDRKLSEMSARILSILDKPIPEDEPESPKEDQEIIPAEEKFIASDPSAEDMSEIHLRSKSPLPGYCKTRPTNTQIYALVNYISKHPALETCFTVVDGNDPHITEWRLLARYLNRLGTAEKSTSSWKRTWRDIKSSVVNNKRQSTPWNDKITEKVKEILNIANTNDEPNDEPNDNMSHSETEEQFDDPSEEMPVYLIPPSHSQEVKPPTLDPLTCDIQNSQEPKAEPDQSTSNDGQTSDMQSESYKPVKQAITVRDLTEMTSKNGHNEPSKPVMQAVIKVHETSKVSLTPVKPMSRQRSRSKSVNSDRMSARSSSQGSEAEYLASFVARDGCGSPMQDDNDNDGDYDRSPQGNANGKKTRCTNLQLRALTDYMCDHPDMALYNLNTKDAATEWRHLTRQLNRMGRAAKSTVAWKRTWRDIKKAVRRGKTGGGLDKARERKVRALLGFQSGADDKNEENDPEIPIEPPAVLTPAEESPLVSIQRCVEMLTKTDDQWATERKVANTSPNDSSATATTADSRNETNSLLKDLVGELRRSNQLKAEQNIYLRELLKQISTLSPSKDNTDSVIHTDTENVPETQNQDTGITIPVEGQFCAEDYCVTQLEPVNIGNGGPVQEVKYATPLVRPVSLMTSTLSNQTSKPTVNLKTVTRLMTPTLQTLPRVSVVKLKGGTVVLKPGSKLPTTTGPNQNKNEKMVYVVRNVKQFNNVKNP